MSVEVDFVPREDALVLVQTDVVFFESIENSLEVSVVIFLGFAEHDDVVGNVSYSLAGL